MLHADLVGYSAYAQRCGFAKAEELASVVGRALLGAAVPAGAQFIGHVSGADFVMIGHRESAPEIAAASIEATDRELRAWVEGASLLSLAIGGVDVTEIRDEEVLARRLVDAMRSAKEGDGGRYVCWRPPTS